MRTHQLSKTFLFGPLDEAVQERLIRIYCVNWSLELIRENECLASCAATGTGTTRDASPRIAADTSPSRVIVSPSASPLVDFDVPADNWARTTLVDVKAELVGICDLELVHVIAGLPIVLDAGHEAARTAIRGAGGTGELRRRGGGECQGADEPGLFGFCLAGAKQRGTTDYADNTDWQRSKSKCFAFGSEISAMEYIALRFALFEMTFS